MNALTNVQIIEQGGYPAFAVIPYEDFVTLTKERYNEQTVPHEVVSKMIDDDMTIFQAWRVFKKMTQQEVAEKMGIPQSNVSRIESGKTSPSFQTIKAYAKALGIAPEQLDLD